jgi:hypothetical protein
MRNTCKKPGMIRPLISTGLQPGVCVGRRTKAVSTASPAREKTAKAAQSSLSRWVTGLQPGANKSKYLEIIEANYISGYKIRLSFNDEKTRVVDFGPFLKQARNPMFAKYRRPKEFKSFHIRDGDLMWGDFEMIFPIADLHRGKI